MDDVLACFGVKMLEEPPKEVIPVLFELSSLYGKEVIQHDPFYDVLGDTYMDLVSAWGQKALGQYFTPWPVAKMMAAINYTGTEATEKALIRVCDPACGSGAMMLAFAQHIVETHGTAALKNYSFTGIDLDRFCTRIFPCQMLSSAFVHQIELGELLVYHGNSLGPLDDLNVVVHVTRADLPKAEYLPAKAPQRAPMIEKIAQTAKAQGQLSLFGEVEEQAIAY